MSTKLQTVNKIQTTNKMQLKASSFESPRERDVTIKRRTMSDITGYRGGQNLCAISPLLGAAQSPGMAPALVPVDEAADQKWLLEDSWLLEESPLALSPDAAARHLPNSLFDIADFQGADVDDNNENGSGESYRMPETPSPLLHSELWPQKIMAENFKTGKDCYWEMGDSLFGDGGLSGLPPAFHVLSMDSWERNAEKSQNNLPEQPYWEGNYQNNNGYWDQGAENAPWDKLWNQADPAEWDSKISDTSWWAKERDVWGGRAAAQHNWPNETSTELSNAERRIAQRLGYGSGVGYSNGAKHYGSPETPEKTPKQKGLPQKIAPGDWQTKDDDQVERSSNERCLAELSGTETTVMLRNIPNKYSRDMLVEQLNQHFMGMFDFMYLPIDFKNKCNVGYGFVNFRTPELCSEFVHGFNGVDVRKCLPGFNSRKVVEVTPARVQGLQDNVRRLRNSPVMSQLKDHPDWLPLMFDGDGQEQPFPEPEHPLPPVRVRGSGRHKDMQR